jgi:hypothetical protein
MGWSTLSVNAELLDAVSDVCFTQTGLNNTWQDKQGTRWFYEINTSKTDASDDSLFGDIYRESDGTHAGNFHIKSGSLIQSHQSFSSIFTLAKSMGRIRHKNIQERILFAVLAEDLRRFGI